MQNGTIRIIPGSKAFTLIELLIVIAILSLLMGLFMPALQAARNEARRLSDMNNMSQIGKAIHMYSARWNDHLPNARVMWPGVKDMWPSHHGALAGPGMDPREHPESLMNLLSPYLNEPRVWVNPNAVAGLNSDGSVTDDNREMIQSYVVYGYNYAMKAYGQPGLMPWSPTFYADNFQNLRGGRLGREGSIMPFWIRNSLTVHEMPSTNNFTLPHGGWGRRPEMHILFNDGRVILGQSTAPEATTPW